MESGTDREEALAQVHPKAGASLRSDHPNIKGVRFGSESAFTLIRIRSTVDQLSQSLTQLDRQTSGRPPRLQRKNRNE